jgi:hypothetical protein
MRRSSIVLAVGAAVLLSLMLPGCAPRTAIEALLVLGDIEAGEGPSLLKRWTAAPARGTLTYEVEGRLRHGDLYQPADAVRAALVLVPGAAREGRDDPRLVALATTFARAGFIVLVPEIASLRQLKIHAADADEIADAIGFVAAGPGAGYPVGIAAISYAVGPALIALSRPAIGERIAFVLGVGAYYDTMTALTYVTTGRYRLPGETEWRRQAPNAFGKWVFVASNADRIDDPGDRARLSAIASRRMESEAADVGDLLAAIGPEARAVYEVASNADPERVESLVVALPPSIRAEIAALSLANIDLSGVTSRVVLLHGANDRIIPHSESRALATALRHARVEVFVIGDLQHVDLGPAGWLDVIRLWRATYLVMAERRSR